MYEAKKVCIQQGNHRPSKEDIAASAGMTVEKLDKLLFTARMPLSIEKPVWMDQDTTFQVFFPLLIENPSNWSHLQEQNAVIYKIKVKVIDTPYMRS